MGGDNLKPLIPLAAGALTGGLGYGAYGLTGVQALTAGAAAAGLTGSAVGAMGKKPDVMAAPTLKTPQVMPEPDDDATRKARRKTYAAFIKNRGRASTVLDTAVSDTLG